MDDAGKVLKQIPIPRGPRCDSADDRVPGPPSMNPVLQNTPVLTIRGAAAANSFLAESSLPKQDEAAHVDELQQLHLTEQEPQASTSAVTLDADVNSTQHESRQAIPKPSKPWGLAEHGIPPPRSDLAPDPSVEAKLRHFHTLRSQGVFFNDSLQNNKSFRNPSILSKLVDFVNVDEKLSNIPSDIWSSSHGVSRDAWAASIADRQKVLADEREKAQQRGKRSNIDFAASSSSTSSSKPKERSKGSDNHLSASRSNHSATKDRDDRKRSRWDKDDFSSSKVHDSDRWRRDRVDGRSNERYRTRSRSPTRRC